MAIPFSMKKSLQVLIKSICSSDPLEYEVYDFVCRCVRISMATLHAFEINGYRIRERNGDEGDLIEIATDCIADLFKRNDRGEFVYVRRYFQPYLNVALTDEEWLMLLRRLVWNRTKQRLFRIFRERDPESATLWRAVKQFAARRENYGIVEYMGKNWLCEMKKQCAKIRYIQITEAYASFNVLGLLRPSDSVPKTIAKVFQTIRNNSKDTMAVEIGELVYIIGSYRNRTQPIVSHIQSPNYDLMPFEFEQKLEIVKKRICTTIDDNYIRKRKLRTKTAEGMKLALCAMLDDMGDGGLTNSYFGYLKEYAPFINEKEYRLRLRAQFEYLAKLLKRETGKIFFG